MWRCFCLPWQLYTMYIPFGLDLKFGQNKERFWSEKDKMRVPSCDVRAVLHSFYVFHLLLLMIFFMIFSHILLFHLLNGNHQFVTKRISLVDDVFIISFGRLCWWLVFIIRWLWQLIETSKSNDLPQNGISCTLHS